MSTVIRAESLSKKFLISHQNPDRYATFRTAVADGVCKLGNRIIKFEFKPKNEEKEEFWALKDVSFEVKKGDRIGIIGRNGAGKSTLLKILSRITEPTTGRISIRGRVASLLEVGTGFHPELTGRENIFLNGAILGMKREEIKRKFDEIVDFAEIEKFLDTPVKRYSSGMYVRLAFAVAAHLEPEILIVDEVLAVGDVQFQKKCLGKMEAISSGEERTVLFVSHNMTAIQHLCRKCILLQHGQIGLVGKTNSVIDRYLNSESLESSSIELSNKKDRKGTGEVRFQTVTFRNKQRKEVNAFLSGEEVFLDFDIVNLKSVQQKNLITAVGIDNNMGERIAVLSNDICGKTIDLNPGKNLVSIHVQNLLLTPGKYHLTLFISANGTICDWLQSACSFLVEQSDYYGSGKMGQDQGYFLLNYDYTV